MLVLKDNHVDQGHAWVVMCAAFIQNILCSSMFASPAVYMLDWMDYFQVTTTQVAVVGSLVVTSGCITGMVVGILVDKFGPRPVSLVGAVISVSALISSALAPEFWMIFITYGILLGVGESFSSIPPILCVQYYFDKKRPFAAGISLAGHSLGTMLMLPLLRILISHYGLRGAMIIHAGILTNIFATSLLFWPVITMKWARLIESSEHSSQACVQEENDKNSPSNKQPIYSISEEKAFNGNLKSLDNVNAEAKSHNKYEEKHSCALVQFIRKHVDFQLLKHTSFVLFLISTVLDEYCISLMYNMTPIKANKDTGIDLLRATILPSIVGTFSTISRLVSSFVANLPCVNRTVYLGVSMLMMGVVTAASCLAYNFATFAASMALFGIFLGAHFTVMATVLTDTVGLDHIAQGFGFQHFFLGISGLSHLSIAGWLIDKTQNYDLPFFIYGGIQMAAGIFMLAILCVKKDMPDDQEITKL